MSNVDLSVWQKISDEELASQFLDLCRRDKRGSQVYQCIEAEMRARNLLHREPRLATSYTESRSSRYDARPMLFAGSSFR